MATGLVARQRIELCTARLSDGIHLPGDCVQCDVLPASVMRDATEAGLAGLDQPGPSWRPPRRTPRLRSSYGTALAVGDADLSSAVALTALDVRLAELDRACSLANGTGGRYSHISLAEGGSVDLPGFPLPGVQAQLAGRRRTFLSVLGYC